MSLDTVIDRTHEAAHMNDSAGNDGRAAQSLEVQLIPRRGWPKL
jgi:hypothetical protein